MERSCLPCRRAHRRCDKKKPTCSLCVARGRQCEWDNTPQTIRFEPYKPPAPAIANPVMRAPPTLIHSPIAVPHISPIQPIITPQINIQPPQIGPPSKQFNGIEYATVSRDLGNFHTIETTYHRRYIRSTKYVLSDAAYSQRARSRNRTLHPCYGNQKSVRRSNTTG
jgi:hypothetical protein